MRKLFTAALRSNGESFASPKKIHSVINGAAIACSITLAAFLFAGCSKGNMSDSVNKTMDEKTNEIANETMNESQHNHPGHSGGNVLDLYNCYSPQTMRELQQARAATAKYRNIQNAIRDGYADISVIVPNMGHHYMKTAYVDATFEIRKPEILVYEKNEDGSFDLVAVEYAVPIDLSPNSAPQGFYGRHDVWDRNTGFGLWLLHAWVWAYNPNGVFNPTNPLVHTH